MPTTLSKDEILEAIGTMSVFELAELIEAFKSRFNVTIAAAPVGGAAPAAGGGGRRRPSRSRRSSTSCSRKRARRRSKSSRSCAS
jgi:ribosomal protein L7/L12